MSLDCSGIVPKNCIMNYTLNRKSDLASVKSNTVWVILILKENLESYWGGFSVTMFKEEAIELSKLIEDKGSCLIVNEALNNSYTIIGFRYRKLGSDVRKPNVILRDGNLFFQEGNTSTHAIPDYMLIRTNLYDEYGRLLEKDVPVNSSKLAYSVREGHYLSYCKDGENRKCYVDDKNISVVCGYVRYIRLDFIPCTYYDEGNVSIGEPINNRMVQLILNTGQLVKVSMLEENLKYMISSVKPSEVVTIGNMPVVVTSYSVMEETSELADCYYDETGLHLITKEYDSNAKYLYRATLEQGISIEFSSNSRLEELRTIVFDNKVVRILSIENIGRVNFFEISNSSYHDPLRRFNSLYMLKINLNGEVMSVVISAIDYMLMQSGNDNYIVIDNKPREIYSYVIETKTTEGLRPDVVLDIIGGCSMLRFFPENK